MINIAVIEDEAKVRSQICKQLNSLGIDINIVGEAESVEEGKELIESKQPDMVFLDIQLKDGDGFQLLDKLKHISFDLVFVTAYNEHAIKAFKYAAIHYLEKPIHSKQLSEAIKRHQKNRNLLVNEEKIATLLENMSTDAHKMNKIALPTVSGFEFIHLNTIYYCKADGGYTHIHFKEGGYLVSKPLNNMQELLPHDAFYRIHNSHIVNLNKIERYNKSDSEVVLHGGVRLDVSSRNKKGFEDMLRKR
jgi:two-component system, LytTR family, response regulator